MISRMISSIGRLVPAIAMVGALLLSSCSTTPSTPATSTGTTDSKPYGSLVIQTLQGAGAPDPQLGSAYWNRAVTAAFFDSLIEMTPAGDLKPGIAERWEIAPDGLSHTFYIRKGVKFHDGSDLTGADVKFSLDRIMAPEATNTNAALWRSIIDRVDMKDDFTVVMRFKSPQIELIKGSAMDGSMAVAPKKYIEEKGVETWRKTLVGSGPFKVVSNEMPTRLVLEAVEDHWREVPKFKTISLLMVSEPATMAAMLKTGELDIATVTSDMAADLKAAGIRTVTWDGSWEYIALLFYDLDNPQQYPLGDVRVRKALSLAVNRQEMGSSLFRGYAKPAALPEVREGAFFYDANVLKPDPYDPEGAKKLLAEAGYASGFNTKLWVSAAGGPIMRTFSEALSGYWGKIGVRAELATAEWPTIDAMLRPKLLPAAYNSVVASQAGGALQFEKMATRYHSAQATFKNIRNPSLDQLIGKVPVTRDTAEKKRLALEAAVLAKNEYNAIGFVNALLLAAVGPKVGEITPYAGLEGLAASYASIGHAK